MLKLYNKYNYLYSKKPPTLFLNFYNRKFIIPFYYPIYKYNYLLHYYKKLISKQYVNNIKIINPLLKIGKSIALDTIRNTKYYKINKYQNTYNNQHLQIYTKWIKNISDVDKKIFMN